MLETLCSCQVTQSKAGGGHLSRSEPVTLNVTTRQMSAARLRSPLGAALGLALAQRRSPAAAGTGGGVGVTPGWGDTHCRALEWAAGWTHPVPKEPGREFQAD